MADVIDVAAAWGFLFFRAMHSAIQCTFNRVMLRFFVYMVSALILWFVVARTAVRLFAGT